MGQFAGSNFTPGPITAGATYMLNVSVTGHANTNVAEFSDDIINAGDGDDVVYGLDGDDTIEGGAGADYLDGGAGDNDTLSYEHSDAGVSAFFFNNTYNNGDATGDTVLNFENISGSAFNDQLIGDSGNNILRGGAGNDGLTGFGGVDQVFGEAGNDSLSTVTTDGLLGATLNGGEGTDKLIVFGLGAAAVTDFGGAAVSEIENLEISDSSAFGFTDIQFHADQFVFDTVVDATAQDFALTIDMDTDTEFSAAGTTFNSTNPTGNVTFTINGDADDENIVGAMIDNVINGGDGDDRIEGGVADDTLNGDGNTATGDTVSYAGATAGVTVSLASQGGSQDTIGAGNDTLNGFENLEGSALGDNLTGDINNNTFFGSDGSDVIDGAGGDNTLDYSAFTQDIVGSIATDNGSLSFDGIAGAETDTFSDIQILTTGSGNDVLTVEGVSSTATNTGAGDDTFVAVNNLSSGNMDGGAGVDTFDGSAETGIGFTVSLGAAGELNDTVRVLDLKNVENFIGGQLTDDVTGDALDNIIDGQGGDDVIDGGMGNDTAVFTGNFADYTIAQAGGLTIVQDTVASRDGSDQVTNVEYFQFADGTIALDQLVGANIVNGTPLDDSGLLGTNGEDIIYGFAGDDFINARALGDSISAGDGDDDIVAGAGADVIDGGGNTAVGDTATYSNSAAGVNVNLATGVNTGGDELIGIENLFGSTQFDTLTGDDGNNNINGFGGNDILDGGAGDDELFGGNGNDTIIGGEGADVVNGGGGGEDEVDYSGSDEGVTVRINGSTATEGFAEGDEVSVTVENIIGSDFVDSLIANTLQNDMIGGAGDDFMNASSNNDTLDGGAGDDFLLGSRGADIINGGSNNAGGDTAGYSNSDARVTVDLTAGTATGSGHGSGDTLIDIENIQGSRYNDDISGDNNNNVLDGFNGNDDIFGLGGNDTLIGGGGADVFAFDTVAFGNDTITDFENNADTIDMSGSGLTFADLTIDDSTGDTIIYVTEGDFDFENTITLEGVTGVIDAGGFVF